jgi:hypothetical protein
MPNWVTNILTVEAENDERLHEILTAITYDDKGLGTIDFNKVSPMPPELDIESSSITNNSLEQYTHFIRAAQLTGCISLQEPLPMSIEDERVKLIASDYEKDAELIAFGAKVYSNKLKYGATDWYSWRSSNQSGHWGTKWNSTPMDDPHIYDGSNRIEFQTAWSWPEPVIVRLSEMFPDAQFRNSWADEDIGVNVGEVLYQDGEQLEYGVPSECSKEAYEMAAGIIGVDISEYELYYSKTKGSYVGREDLAWEDMTADANVHIGENFYCEQTDGFPTYLYYDTAIGAAWLKLSEGSIDMYIEGGEKDTVERCQQFCKDWGVRICDSMDDYENLLNGLGARMCDEDEGFEMGGIT